MAPALGSFLREDENSAGSRKVACSTPDASRRSIVRGSADLTTVTIQPGHRKLYVPLPSSALILT